MLGILLLSITLLSLKVFVAAKPKTKRYLGLTPSIRQSADHCYHGSITKAGNSLARRETFAESRIFGKM